MEPMPVAPESPLQCPICQRPLELAANALTRLRCTEGHSYDAAKQGYFNLLVGKGTAFEADSAAMVAARHNFLAAGHYLPLATAVAAAVVPHLPATGGAVLDSGTGTGQYLRVLLDTAAAANVPVASYGLDISKYALRRAARLNPESINVVWDVWQPLPLADHSVDAVTVIFAPRNPAEFARVLRPGGRLLVVAPGSGHLSTLATATGMLAIEDDKEDRLRAAMTGHFSLESAADLTIPLVLSRTEAADLAFMGPAGHHLDQASLRTTAELWTEPVNVEAKFRLLAFTRQTA